MKHERCHDGACQGNIPSVLGSFLRADGSPVPLPPIMTRKFGIRIIALFTLLAFVLTQPVGAQPIPSAARALEALPVFFSPEDLRIPSEVGSIQEIYNANGFDSKAISPPAVKLKMEKEGASIVSGKLAPTVILIQDAHAIIDAQNNIQKIIGFFQEKYGISTIAFEGGSGELDPRLLRTFPDEFVKSKVLNRYLESAELSGVEMAAILNPKEANYVGIEDWKLYEQNFIAYLEATKNKEKVLKQLREEKQKLDAERAKVYSPALNEFHEKVNAFRSEKSNLTELLKHLSNQKGSDPRLAVILSEAKDLDPSATPQDDSLKDYPHLSALIKTLENEEAVSTASLDTDLRKMAHSFKKRYATRLSKEQAMKFQESCQAFHTGQIDAGSFLKNLVSAGQSIGVNPRLTPAMQQALRQNETLSMIKGTQLFEELENFLKETEAGLIKKPEERELAKKYHELRLVESLAKLELTREEWEEVQALSVKRQAVSEKRESLLTAYRLPLTAHFDFYRLANERDSAFFSNLQKIMLSDKRKTIKKNDSDLPNAYRLTPNAVILVTGGFHTAGIQQHLKANGISYAVVTPKMNSLTGQEAYDAIMQGKLSYKRYLETSFYDAFMRDSTEKLVFELNQPDFKRNLKLWRDDVIRNLSGAGRIHEAGEYTRYIDLLLKVYYDKYDRVSQVPKTREEIQTAIREELNRFAGEASNKIWDQFQTQFKEFANGLRGLVKDNNLNVQNVSNLLEAASNASVLSGHRHALMSASRNESRVLLDWFRNRNLPALLPGRSDAAIQEAYKGFQGKRTGRIFDPDDRKTYDYSLSVLTQEMSQAERSGAKTPILDFWKNAIREVFTDFQKGNPRLTSENFNLLEIGSGDGTLGIALVNDGNYHYLGINFDPQFVQTTQKKYRDNKQITFEQGDATDLKNISNESQHVVLLNEGLGNLPLFLEQAQEKSQREGRPVQPLFHELARVLAPGGHLVIHDFNEENSQKATQLAGYLNYPIQKRIEALEAAGFEIVKQGYVKTAIRQFPQTHFIVARKSDRSEARKKGESKLPRRVLSFFDHLSRISANEIAIAGGMFAAAYSALVRWIEYAAKFKFMERMREIGLETIGMESRWQRIKTIIPRELEQTKFIDELFQRNNRVGYLYLSMILTELKELEGALFNILKDNDVEDSESLITGTIQSMQGEREVPLLVKDHLNSLQRIIFSTVYIRIMRQDLNQIEKEIIKKYSAHEEWLKWQKIKLEKTPMTLEEALFRDAEQSRKLQLQGIKTVLATLDFSRSESRLTEESEVSGSRYAPPARAGVPTAPSALWTRQSLPDTARAEARRLKNFQSQTAVVDRGTKVFQKAQSQKAGDFYHLRNIVANGGDIFGGNVLNRNPLKGNDRSVNFSVGGDNGNSPTLVGGVIAQGLSHIPGDHGVSGAGIKNQIHGKSSTGAGEFNGGNDNTPGFFGNFNIQGRNKMMAASVGRGLPVKETYKVTRLFPRLFSFLNSLWRSLSWAMTFPSSLAVSVKEKAIQLFRNFLRAVENLMVLPKKNDNQRLSASQASFSPATKPSMSEAAVNQRPASTAVNLLPSPSISRFNSSLASLISSFNPFWASAISVFSSWRVSFKSLSNFETASSKWETLSWVMRLVTSSISKRLELPWTSISSLSIFLFKSLWPSAIILTLWLISSSRVPTSVGVNSILALSFFFITTSLLSTFMILGVRSGIIRPNLSNVNLLSRFFNPQSATLSPDTRQILRSSAKQGVGERPEARLRQGSDGRIRSTKLEERSRAEARGSNADFVIRQVQPTEYKTMLEKAWEFNKAENLPGEANDIASRFVYILTNMVETPSSPSSILFVAQENEQIAGMSYLEALKSTPGKEYLEPFLSEKIYQRMVYVAPRYRRRGLGIKFAIHALQFLKSRNIRYYFAAIERGNRSAFIALHTAVYESLRLKIVPVPQPQWFRYGDYIVDLFPERDAPKVEWFKGESSLPKNPNEAFRLHSQKGDIPQPAQPEGQAPRPEAREIQEIPIYPHLEDEGDKIDIPYDLLRENPLILSIPDGFDEDFEPNDVYYRITLNPSGTILIHRSETAGEWHRDEPKIFRSEQERLTIQDKNGKPLFELARLDEELILTRIAKANGDEFIPFHIESTAVRPEARETEIISGVLGNLQQKFVHRGEWPGGFPVLSIWIHALEQWRAGLNQFGDAISRVHRFAEAIQSRFFGERAQLVSQEPVEEETSGSDILNKNLSFFKKPFIFFKRPKVESNSSLNIDEGLSPVFSLGGTARKSWYINAISAFWLFFQNNFIFHSLSSMSFRLTELIYNTASLLKPNVFSSSPPFSPEARPSFAKASEGRPILRGSLKANPRGITFISRSEAHQFEDVHLNSFIQILWDIENSLGENHPAVENTELGYIAYIARDSDLSEEELKKIIANSDFLKGREKLEKATGPDSAFFELGSKMEFLFALFNELSLSRSEARVQTVAEAPLEVREHLESVLTGDGRFYEATQAFLRVGTVAGGFYYVDEINRGDLTNGIPAEALQQGRVIYLPTDYFRRYGTNILGFPYGMHTFLTLFMMIQNRKAIKDRIVLDIGHGEAGIVTLTALRLGAQKVIAIEKDSWGESLQKALMANDLNTSDVRIYSGTFEDYGKELTKEDLKKDIGLTPIFISNLGYSETLKLFTALFPLIQNTQIRPFFIVGGGAMAGSVRSDEMSESDEDWQYFKNRVVHPIVKGIKEWKPVLKGYTVRKTGDDNPQSLGFTIRTEKNNSQIQGRQPIRPEAREKGKIKKFIEDAALVAAAIVAVPALVVILAAFFIDAKADKDIIAIRQLVASPGSRSETREVENWLREKFKGDADVLNRLLAKISQILEILLEVFDPSTGSFKSRQSLSKTYKIVFSRDGWKNFINESKIFVYRIEVSINSIKAHFDKMNIRFEPLHFAFNALHAIAHIIQILTENSKLTPEIFEHDGEFAFAGMIGTSFWIFVHVWKLTGQGTSVNIFLFKKMIDKRQNEESLGLAKVTEKDEESLWPLGEDILLTVYPPQNGIIAFELEFTADYLKRLKASLNEAEIKAFDSELGLAASGSESRAEARFEPFLLGEQTRSEMRESISFSEYLSKHLVQVEVAPGIQQVMRLLHPHLLPSAHLANSAKIFMAKAFYEYARKGFAARAYNPFHSGYIPAEIEFPKISHWLIGYDIAILADPKNFRIVANIKTPKEEIELKFHEKNADAMIEFIYFLLKLDRLGKLKEESEKKLSERLWMPAIYSALFFVSLTALSLIPLFVMQEVNLLLTASAISFFTVMAFSSVMISIAVPATEASRKSKRLIDAFVKSHKTASLQRSEAREKGIEIDPSGDEFHLRSSEMEKSISSSGIMLERSADNRFSAFELSYAGRAETRSEALPEIENGQLVKPKLLPYVPEARKGFPEPMGTLIKEDFLMLSDAFQIVLHVMRKIPRNTAVNILSQRHSFKFYKETDYFSKKEYRNEAIQQIAVPEYQRILTSENLPHWDAYIMLNVMDSLLPVLEGQELNELKVLKEWASTHYQEFVSGLVDYARKERIVLPLKLMDSPQELEHLIRHERLHQSIARAQQTNSNVRAVLEKGYQSLIQEEGVLFLLIEIYNFSPAYITQIESGSFGDEWRANTRYVATGVSSRPDKFSAYQKLLGRYRELAKTNPDIQIADELIERSQKKSDEVAEDDLRALRLYQAGQKAEVKMEEQKTLPMVPLPKSIEFILHLAAETKVDLQPSSPNDLARQINEIFVQSGIYSKSYASAMGNQIFLIIVRSDNPRSRESFFIKADELNEALITNSERAEARSPRQITNENIPEILLKRQDGRPELRSGLKVPVTILQSQSERTNIPLSELLTAKKTGHQLEILVPAPESNWDQYLFDLDDHGNLKIRYQGHLPAGNRLWTWSYTKEEMEQRNPLYVLDPHIFLRNRKEIIKHEKEMRSRRPERISFWQPRAKMLTEILLKKQKAEKLSLLIGRLFTVIYKDGEFSIRRNMPDDLRGPFQINYIPRSDGSTSSPSRAEVRAKKPPAFSEEGYIISNGETYLVSFRELEDILSDWNAYLIKNKKNSLFPPLQTDHNPTENPFFQFIRDSIATSSPARKTRDSQSFQQLLNTLETEGEAVYFKGYTKDVTARWGINKILFAFDKNTHRLLAVALFDRYSAISEYIPNVMIDIQARRKAREITQAAVMASSKKAPGHKKDVPPSKWDPLIQWIKTEGGFENENGGTVLKNEIWLLQGGYVAKGPLTENTVWYPLLLNEEQSKLLEDYFKQVKAPNFFKFSGLVIRTGTDLHSLSFVLNHLPALPKGGLNESVSVEEVTVVPLSFKYLHYKELSAELKFLADKMITLDLIEEPGQGRAIYEIAPTPKIVEEKSKILNVEGAQYNLLWLNWVIKNQTKLIREGRRDIQHKIPRLLQEELKVANVKHQRSKGLWDLKIGQGKPSHRLFLRPVKGTSFIAVVGLFHKDDLLKEASEENEYLARIAALDEEAFRRKLASLELSDQFTLENVGLTSTRSEARSEKITARNIAKAAPIIRHELNVFFSVVTLADAYLNMLLGENEGQKYLKTLYEAWDNLKEIHKREPDVKRIREELVIFQQTFTAQAINVANDIKPPLIAKGKADLAEDLSRRLLETADKIYDFIETRLNAVDQTSEQIDLIEAVEGIFFDLNLSSIATRQFNPAQNLMIEGNKTKLDEIFFNLLRNAKEHTGRLFPDPKDWKITVKIYESPGAPDSITIEVQDNGEGIPEENKKKILKGFTSKENGNGTGLPTIRKYIEKDFGGTIRVDSIQPPAPNHGSNFIVTLSKRPSSRAELRSEFGNTFFKLGGWASQIWLPVFLVAGMDHQIEWFTLAALLGPAVILPFIGLLTLGMNLWFKVRIMKPLEITKKLSQLKVRVSRIETRIRPAANYRRLEDFFDYFENNVSNPLEALRRQGFDSDQKQIEKSILAAVDRIKGNVRGGYLSSFRNIRAESREESIDPSSSRSEMRDNNTKVQVQELRPARARAQKKSLDNLRGEMTNHVVYYFMWGLDQFKAQFEEGPLDDESLRDSLRDLLKPDPNETISSYALKIQEHVSRIIEYIHDVFEVYKPIKGTEDRKMIYQSILNLIPAPQLESETTTSQIEMPTQIAPKSSEDGRAEVREIRKQGQSPKPPKPGTGPDKPSKVREQGRAELREDSIDREAFLHEMQGMAREIRLSQTDLERFADNLIFILNLDSSDENRKVDFPSESKPLMINVILRAARRQHPEDFDPMWSLISRVNWFRKFYVQDTPESILKQQIGLIKNSLAHFFNDQERRVAFSAQLEILSSLPKSVLTPNVDYVNLGRQLLQHSPSHLNSILDHVRKGRSTGEYWLGQFMKGLPEEAKKSLALEVMQNLNRGVLRKTKVDVLYLSVLVTQSLNALDNPVGFLTDVEVFHRIYAYDTPEFMYRVNALVSANEDSAENEESIDDLAGSFNDLINYHPGPAMVRESVLVWRSLDPKNPLLTDQEVNAFQWLIKQIPKKIGNTRDRRRQVHRYLIALVTHRLLDRSGADDAASRFMGDVIAWIDTSQKNPDAIYAILEFLLNFTNLSRELQTQFAEENQELLTGWKRQSSQKLFLTDEHFKTLNQKIQETLINSLIMGSVLLTKKEKNRLRTHIGTYEKAWNRGDFLKILAGYHSFQNIEGKQSVEKLIRQLFRAKVKEDHFTEIPRYGKIAKRLGPELIDKMRRGINKEIPVPSPTEVLKVIFSNIKQDILKHAGISLNGEEIDVTNAVLKAFSLEKNPSIPEEELNAFRSILLEVLKSLDRPDPIDIAAIRRWKTTLFPLQSEAAPAWTVAHPEWREILVNLDQIGMVQHFDFTKIKRLVFEITDDPVALVRSASEPYQTCQRCTEPTAYNRKGEPINRVRQGQFLLARILAYDEEGKAQVVARSLLEIANGITIPYQEKRTVLTAERFYQMGFLPPSQMQNYILEWATEGHNIDFVLFAGQKLPNQVSQWIHLGFLDSDGEIYRDTFRRGPTHAIDLGKIKGQSTSLRGLDVQRAYSPSSLRSEMRLSDHLPTSGQIVDDVVRLGIEGAIREWEIAALKRIRVDPRENIVNRLYFDAIPSTLTELELADWVGGFEFERTLFAAVEETIPGVTDTTEKRILLNRIRDNAIGDRILPSAEKFSAEVLESVPVNTYRFGEWLASQREALFADLGNKKYTVTIDNASSRPVQQALHKFARGIGRLEIVVGERESLDSAPWKKFQFSKVEMHSGQEAETLADINKRGFGETVLFALSTQRIPANLVKDLMAIRAQIAELKDPKLQELAFEAALLLIFRLADQFEGVSGDWLKETLEPGALHNFMQRNSDLSVLSNTFTTKNGSLEFVSQGFYQDLERFEEAFSTAA